MPEIKAVGPWYYILRTKTAAVRLGKDQWHCLYAEPIDPEDEESVQLANLLNEIPYEKVEYCFDWRDFDYEPPRNTPEKILRERLDGIEGLPREYTLEYISPPGEVYVGPEPDQKWRAFCNEHGILYSPW
jgi:hypothetical protein